MFDTIAVFDTISVFDTLYVTQIDTVYLTVTDTLVIDISLIGVNPIQFQYQVLVYPNPANDILLVSVPTIMISQSYSIEINNSLGQSVFTAALNQQTIQINLNSFAANGTYILRILDSGGTSIIEKVVILQ